MADFTQETVVMRIQDWIHRLNNLYDQLDEWLPGDSSAIVMRQSIPQVIEPLMSKFKVRPQYVPTYSVLINKLRIAFVPSALWIVGANGRVNVTTNWHQYILVDIGGKDGQPSNWHLVQPDDRVSLRPFNREAFLALLKEKR